MKKNRYQPDFPVRAAAVIRNGGSESAVAQALGITLTALKRYRQLHAEFEMTFLPGETADRDVEQALFKRARGFRYEEVQLEELVDREGKVLETLKKRTVVKEVPPDLRAVLFWLTNRCPERWKEKGAGPADIEESYAFDEADERL